MIFSNNKYATQLDDIQEFIDILHLKKILQFCRSDWETNLLLVNNISQT